MDSGSLFLQDSENRIYLLSSPQLLDPREYGDDGNPPDTAGVIHPKSLSTLFNAILSFHSWVSAHYVSIACNINVFLTQALPVLVGS